MSTKPILRLEALALLAGALVLYAHLGGGWGHFALWFLAPDLVFLAYAAGARAGAFAYNVVHSLIGPLTLALLGVILPTLLPAAIVWIAHIAADRALGYDLKS